MMFINPKVLEIQREHTEGWIGRLNCENSLKLLFQWFKKTRIYEYGF